MKKAFLLIALLAAATFTFGQNKSDEKPLRKIATGNGARQIEEAMKDLRIELDNLDIEINEEVEEAMREMRQELRELDELDIDIDIDNDRDFDFDFDFDHDFDIDIDIDIDEIVDTALRAVDEEEIERIVNKAVKESTRSVKVRVREP